MNDYHTYNNHLLNKHYHNDNQLLPNGYMNTTHINTNKLYDPYNAFIRGNLFESLYDPYTKREPFKIEPLNEQAELLTYIDAYFFAGLELKLYLDNHPNDRDAFNLFNQYRKDYDKYLKDYESKYGPILINSNAIESYPWAWVNNPWPWDNK